MKKTKTLLQYVVMLLVACSFFVLEGVTADAASSTNTKALKAYGAYLEENSYSYEYFAIVDLNNDGVKEVLMSAYDVSYYGFYDAVVLTYNKGKVKATELTGSGTATDILYNSSTKTYFLTGKATASLYNEVVTYNSNRIGVAKTTASSIDKDGEHYTYNGKSISYSKYKTYMQSNYGYNFRTYSYTSKIKEVTWYKNSVKNRLSKLNYIQASEVTTSTVPANSVKSGNTLYTTLPYSESNLGIVKIDLSTLKKTTLLQSRLSIHEEQNAEQLSKQGDYLYYALDSGYSLYTDYNIYKMNVNTKKTTNLAKGMSPVIINDWIYYIKVDTGLYSTMESTVGIYKMKLDGSKQTLVKKTDNVFSLSKKGTTLYADSISGAVYTVNLKTGKLTKSTLTSSYGTYENYVKKSGGYYYFVEDGNFYKVNAKTKKMTKICSVQDELLSLEIYGDYALVASYNENNTAYYHLVNLKTKKRTLIKKWELTY